MTTPSPLSDSPRQESDPENSKKWPRRVSPAPSADSDPDWDPHLAVHRDMLILHVEYRYLMHITVLGLV